MKKKAIWNLTASGTLLSHLGLWHLPDFFLSSFFSVGISRGFTTNKESERRIKSWSGLRSHRPEGEIDLLDGSFVLSPAAVAGFNICSCHTGGRGAEQCTMLKYSPLHTHMHAHSHMYGYRLYIANRLQGRKPKASVNIASCEISVWPGRCK